MYGVWAMKMEDVPKVLANRYAYETYYKTFNKFVTVVNSLLVPMTK
jgi:hypothetical protein